MVDNRLGQQIQFMLEIDKLKNVLRQTPITGGRQENSAEHSWHLAVLAVLLAEYANEPIDLLRVIKMVLVHDVVEVDAGDTYCYDEQANVGKADRERRAAERIFGLLPGDQAKELRGLWDEFEERKTPESRFANALDRVQPVILNYMSGGKAWIEHGVSVEQVMKRNRPIEAGSSRLWEHIHGLITDAANKGYLRK
ncbi:MAG: HD domain-containing protein [Bacillota bacterium]